MVNVTIVYTKKSLSEVTIKGHANSGEFGKDLVCAAVSAIAIGSLNALDGEGENFDIEIDEGYVHIVAKGPISEHDTTVLETMIIQLKTIELSPTTKGTIAIKERK